jgi:two-component system, chemotaxis family, chemotaxis protein CheY
MNSLHILVVEDELTSRKILTSFLKPLGHCDNATDGLEAVALVRQSLEAGTPYSLICLDIKLPGMDGHAVLKEIRRLEHERGIDPGNGAKVIMTTVMDDPKSIMGAFKSQCEAYILKPVEKNKLMEQLGKLGLLGNNDSP